ncbi:MAG: hypothetical protein AAGU27_26290 [Dehalobacterium sp.]
MRNTETESKWQATLTDWAIVQYPNIYKSTENTEAVFAKLNCGHPVALFGKAKNDPRYNAESGAFTDGHRLITSPIIALKAGKYHTSDTIYSLDEEEKNTEFKKWCEENQYKEVPLTGVWDKNEEQGNMVLRYICENCGKEQLLSSEEGYKQGWDYPPKMGAFKTVSPRTCGECGIQTTLWWEITCNKTPLDQLSERHQQTLRRILIEPESILP